jgi:hypothetical protein
MLRRRLATVARWLFAPEPLAVDPRPVPPARRSLAAALLAREPLPLDPVPPARAGRARWGRWLLAPERLDGDDPPATER